MLTLDLSMELIAAVKDLAQAASRLKFGPPVVHVYNPLVYAWAAHREYLVRYGSCPKRAVFLGMNPGPFGMVQTGIPFGEVAAVRDWLKISVTIEPPATQHPRRPILGFACRRSEVSGRRLWGLFAQHFSTPERFFAEHFVINYCPLAFMDATGRNVTPVQLASADQEKLRKVCDYHLARALQVLRPTWLIAVGRFAGAQARAAANPPCQVGEILHPSPANPKANHDWAKAAEGQLRALEVWQTD